jgi:hypothetical protein
VRVAIGLTGGLGWAALSRFHRGVEDWSARVGAASAQARFDAPPRSHFVITGDASVRGYFPRHAWVQLATTVLANHAGATLHIGARRAGVAYDNLGVALSMAVGAHLSPWGPLTLYAGFGPSGLVHVRSRWRYDLGRVSSFRAARGGGFVAVLGTDVHLSSWIALTAELQYRYLRTGPLVPAGVALPPLQPLGHLDLSGVQGALGVRAFVW